MNSFIQSICGAFVAISLGLSSIAKKNSTKKIIIFKILIIMMFIASKDVSFSDPRLLTSPSYSKSDSTQQGDANIIHLLEAKELVDDKGAAIYQVSTSSTHNVIGLDSYHPSEHESLEASFTLHHSHLDTKNIILVSHDLNAAFEMANNLRGLQKNVFIVDSSNKVVNEQLGLFFNENTPTNLSIPVSPSDMRLTGTALYLELNEYTVIKLTNYNLLDSGMYAHGMTFDMFSLMLSDMKTLASAKRFETHRNVMFVFPNGLSQDNMKRVSEYLLANIESAGIPLKSKTAEFVNTEMLDSVFSNKLRVEDFNTSPIPANRAELTAEEIKAALVKHDEINLVCFANNCSNTAQAIKGLTAVGVDIIVSNNSLYEVTTQLQENMNKPVIIVADNMSSLKLAKLTSNTASYYGNYVLGITTLDTLNGLADNTAEINSISYAIELAANLVAPETPFNTSTFILLFVGALAALLICAPYRTMKVAGAITFTYSAYYHHLWIHASPVEYGYSLSMLVTIFMLGSYIFGVHKNKKTLVSVLPIALASMSICGLFIHIMMPPADKLLFGFVFGLNICLFIKNQNGISAKTCSNIIGLKYQLTAPLVSGFKGFVVGNDKKFNIFSRLLSRKWIIYHNHTTIYGSEAGGFCGFVVSDRATLNDQISKLSTACSDAGMNHKDIQFWVFPILSDELYRGTVESHANLDDLCWSYTLLGKNKEGEISSTQRDISRTERPANWVEWQLYYRLKRAELEYDKGVKITVHISKWFKVVRVTEVGFSNSSKTESVALIHWRKSGAQAKNRTATVYTNETISVLNQICNGAIVYGNHYSYLLAKQEEVFDIQVAHRCMTQLQGLITRKGLTRELAITEMTEYFAPVLRMKANKRETLNGSHQDVMMAAINFCKKYSPPPISSEMMILPPPTDQLVISHLFRMAVVIYKNIR